LDFPQEYGNPKIKRRRYTILNAFAVFFCCGIRKYDISMVLPFYHAIPCKFPAKSKFLWKFFEFYDTINKEGGCTMYKRIVLKLSGEALAGDKDGAAFDDTVIWGLVRQIKTVIEKGTQVCLVVGGGNFWRGRSASSNMDRTKADQIGMMATVMNAVYLTDAFRQNGIHAVVQTPIPFGTVTELFSKDSALAHLEKGEVVIFAAGLGHPFFSTDTITALRGAELEADGLFFAKNIDGVYDDDPAVNPRAKKIDVIRSEDIVKNNLKVIDLAASALCFEQKIPVIIFGLNEENSIIRAVGGEKIGTIVTVS
jgi:uridylate kinase